MANGQLFMQEQEKKRRAKEQRDARSNKRRAQMEAEQHLQEFADEQHRHYDNTMGNGDQASMSPTQEAPNNYSSQKQVVPVTEKKKKKQRASSEEEDSLDSEGDEYSSESGETMLCYYYVFL